jgi:GTPase Era involved in 16S rRNA processing
VHLQIDRLTKEQRPMLGQLQEHLHSIYPFQETFCISAKHGVGMTRLRQYLLSRCALSWPNEWEGFSIE